MKQFNATGLSIAKGPYSQATITDKYIFISGQIPVNPNSGKIDSGTLSGQTEQVIKNINIILAELNKSFADVVKTTCFLTDMSGFAIFNRIYERAFKSLPARSCVEVNNLPLNSKVEIELIVEA